MGHRCVFDGGGVGRGLIVWDQIPGKGGGGGGGGGGAGGKERIRWYMTWSDMKIGLV